MKSFFSKLAIIALFAFSITNLSFAAERGEEKYLETLEKEYEQIKKNPTDSKLIKRFEDALMNANEAYKRNQNEWDDLGYGAFLTTLNEEVKTLIKPKPVTILDQLATAIENAVEPNVVTLKDILASHNLSIADFLKNINQYVDKKNNWTMLMYAANFGFPKVVNLLLQAGANKTLEEAFSYAKNEPLKNKSADYKEIRNNLLAAAIKNAKDPNVNLTDLLDAHKLSLADFLKNINQDIDKQNHWTMIMYAANFGFSEVVNLLLQAGANKTLETALDLAKKEPIKGKSAQYQKIITDLKNKLSQ